MVTNEHIQFLSRFDQIGEWARSGYRSALDFLSNRTVERVMLIAMVMFASAIGVISCSVGIGLGALLVGVCLFGPVMPVGVAAVVFAFYITLLAVSVLAIIKIATRLSYNILVSAECAPRIFLLENFRLGLAKTLDQWKTTYKIAGWNVLLRSCFMPHFDEIALVDEIYAHEMHRVENFFRLQYREGGRDFEAQMESRKIRSDMLNSFGISMSAHHYYRALHDITQAWLEVRHQRKTRAEMEPKLLRLKNFISKIQSITPPGQILFTNRFLECYGITSAEIREMIIFSSQALRVLEFPSDLIIKNFDNIGVASIIENKANLELCDFTLLKEVLICFPEMKEDEEAEEIEEDKEAGKIEEDEEEDSFDATVNELSLYQLASCGITTKRWRSLLVENVLSSDLRQDEVYLSSEKYSEMERAGMLNFLKGEKTIAPEALISNDVDQNIKYLFVLANDYLCIDYYKLFDSLSLDNLFKIINLYSAKCEYEKYLDIEKFYSKFHLSFLESSTQNPFARGGFAGDSQALMRLNNCYEKLFIYISRRLLNSEVGVEDIQNRLVAANATDFFSHHINLLCQRHLRSRAQ